MRCRYPHASHARPYPPPPLALALTSYPARPSPQEPERARRNLAALPQPTALPPIGFIFIVPPKELRRGITEEVALVRVAGFCEDTGSLLLQQVFADGRPSRIEKASGALLRRLGPSPPESLPPEIVAAAAAALECGEPSPIWVAPRAARHTRVPTIPVLYM